MGSLSVKEQMQAVHYDLKASIHVLFENFGPFFKANVMALMMSIGVSLIIFLLHPFFPFQMDRERSFFQITNFIEIILFAFARCQYGLAYEIMSTGNLCTEFKEIFKYYKKNWWQYLVLSLILNLARFIPMPPYEPGSWFDGRIFEQFLNFIFLVLFIEIFPSITVNGKFKISIRENFQILKRNPLRILVTWGLFFVIFTVPAVLLRNYIFDTSMVWVGRDVRTSFFLINTIILSLIGFFSYPMQALISTRIYNDNMLNSTNIQKNHTE